MLSVKTSLFTAAAVMSALASARGQGFDVGSRGTTPLNVTTNTVIDLPADGVLHYTTVNVAAGAIVTFRRNAANTPVTILARADIRIEGAIVVDGQAGSVVEPPPRAGEGGPGGFDGGFPGTPGETPAGAGQGPGGGARAAGAGAFPGAGAYGGVPDIPDNRMGHGTVYGSPLLLPLVGGSGGGGSAASTPTGFGSGGGGGGGAILLASNTRVDIVRFGGIYARGGGSGVGPGSGGAIRLLAPAVAGGGVLAVQGGHRFGSLYAGGHGRIRIDALFFDEATFSYQPASAVSLGSFLVTFPPASLTLVDVAGSAVKNPLQPLEVLLPFGSSPQRAVTVRAQGFAPASVVPIEVVLTPRSGDPVRFSAVIDTAASDRVAVPVTFPVNTRTYVAVWTAE
jgi:hypothetical protein